MEDQKKGRPQWERSLPNYLQAELDRARAGEKNMMSAFVTASPEPAALAGQRATEQPS